MKTYIGKGTQIPNMQIAKCIVKVAELLKFKHEYEGEEYITFEVSKMQNPDKLGRDYKLYCTTHEEVADEKQATKKRKSKKAENADIPF